MEEPFDYSQVPFTFGMCAAENCPQASTCLRQIALRQRIHVHNKCTHSARGKHVPLSDDRISGT